MKYLPAVSSSKNPVKFIIPTGDNLVPIRIDIESDGQRFRDAFTWNLSDPDSEMVVFAKRTVKDLKLPVIFVTLIAQTIQVSQYTNHIFPPGFNCPIYLNFSPPGMHQVRKPIGEQKFSTGIYEQKQIGEFTRLCDILDD